MDKYEYKVRSEELVNLYSEEKYIEAAKIADSIDWRRVKSVSMLIKISDLYRRNKRNEDGRDILLLAYDRYPTNRSVLSSLCEVSIELDDVVAAIEFYKQFVRVAPDASEVYTLRYRILEAQEASIEERIAILEDLKVKDYQEEWVYELAYLYHRAGLATKCAEVCDELILWMGDGPYVMKAMELKALHVPLTPDQQARYNFMLSNADNNYSAPIYEDNGAEEPYQQEPTYDENGNPIYDDVPYDENGNPIYDETSYDENGNYIGNESFDSNYDEGYGQDYNCEYDENGNPIIYEDDDFYQDQTFDENGNPIDAIEEQPAQASSAQVDMSQYNTINLQKVVAESMKELFPDDDVFAEEREKLNAGEEYVTDVSPEEETKVYAGIEQEQNQEVEEEAAPMTGQMKLDDVLSEWERTKQDNAKRHQEEIRNQILSQTGQMFADFDTSVNNDIMAKLDDSAKVTIKGGSVIASTVTDDDIDEVEELVDIEESTPESYEEMSELEKAVASELGGTTQNLLVDALNAMADSDITQTDGDGADDIGGVYYEQDQYAGDEANNYEMEDETANGKVSDLEVHDTASLEHIEAKAPDVKESVSGRDIDPDDEFDIAQMAREDALKTQEIKMNTAELSNLSEKIVETTTKEAEAAKPEQVRDFSEEELQLFENYAVTKKIKKQIINALDNMSLAAYTGNVIITGEAGIDTMRMAKNLIKEYQAIDPNFSGKIAKITGEKINERSIKEIFDKLDNGGIIIEKANGMSGEKLYEMASLLNQENLGIIVILEDTKKEISKLLEKQAFVADYFNIRIDLMEMDNNALVAYAKNYALALEYAIDELGTLALYTRIANMQSGNHVVTKDEVRDIIDEAIYKSKKSKIKNFVDVIFSRRYNSEDKIVLKERDFI